jgi:hypothetical protein
MLWRRRVRVGVMEHVECALAFAYRKLERLSALGVGDRNRHAVLARVPQQADVDPVDGAAVEQVLTTNRRAPRGQARCVGGCCPTGLELRDPALKEAPLALRARQRERALKRFARLIGPAEPTQ